MENCSCIYVDTEEGVPEFCSYALRKARKIHKCIECSKEIKPGEKYEYFSGKFEEGFDTYKTCLNCVSIREVFFCHGWNFEYINEDLHSHIQEMQGEISEDCLKALTEGARAIVCEMIENYWKDFEEDE